MSAKGTIGAALRTIGVTLDAVTDVESVEVEFGRIKKLWIKAVLSSHPDKGGDPTVFRSVQAAWEVIRDLYDKGRVHASGFAYYFNAGATQEAAPLPADFAERPAKAYGWYEEAATEEVPKYKVELARSDRSQCKRTGEYCMHGDDPFIMKGSVRVGSMDPESGTYGRWNHLPCWRVPASIHLGLPRQGSSPKLFETAIESMQQVVFTGFTELSREQKNLIISHLMDSANYARLTKASKSATPPSGAGTKADAGAGFGTGGGGGGGGGAGAGMGGRGEGSAWGASAPTTAIVSSGGGGGGKFILPRPGLNGAQAGAFRGQTFVMTGIFPEVGGGVGLELGKGRVKGMIESFGGRVTSAVSGKTDFLVVGTQPGAKKVLDAVDKGVKRVDVQTLKDSVEKGVLLDSAPDAVITDFSAGYYGNGRKDLADMVHEKIKNKESAPPAMIGGGGANAGMGVGVGAEARSSGVGAGASQPKKRKTEKKKSEAVATPSEVEVKAPPLKKAAKRPTSVTDKSPPKAAKAVAVKSTRAAAIAVPVKKKGAAVSLAVVAAKPKPASRGKRKREE